MARLFDDEIKRLDVLVERFNKGSMKSRRLHKLSNRTESILKEIVKLERYSSACEKFTEEVDNLIDAVDQYGSDPLNILSLLKPGLIEVPKPIEARQVSPPPEPAPKPEPHQLLTKEEAEKFIKETDEVAPTTGAPYPKGWSEDRAKTVQARVDEKNQKNVTWLYKTLMAGPLDGKDVKKLADMAGITEYAIMQARRSVSDIHISKAIGFQGPQFWYLDGQEKKLPTPDEIGTNRKPKVAAAPDLSPQETTVYNYLPATQAELIGKTHMTPEKVRMNLTSLSSRKMVRFNNQSGVWSKV